MARSPRSLRQRREAFTAHRARTAPTAPYRADAFALAVPEGWSDATTHTIQGPLADGLPHTVTVASAPHDGLSLTAFAAAQTADALAALPGAVLLLQDELTREDGAPAARSIFRWSPLAGEIRYHQQVYTLLGARGLTVATTFTRRSRQTLGPEVLRLALSLTPPKP